MEKDKVILSREGDIGFMTLNNPPENYLEKPDFIDLTVFEDFTRTGIKALVVSGAGRHFSAGADTGSILNQIREVSHFQQQLVEGNRLLDYIDALSIPVIAAVSGVCFGAGLEIALACDIRICDEQVLFAFPEVNLNLMPGLGGIRRLAALAGEATALELVLRGDLITATKAYELKIVDEVVDKKQTLSQATHLATKITTGRSLQVINAVMQSIHNSETLDHDEVIKRDAALFSTLAINLLNETKEL